MLMPLTEKFSMIQWLELHVQMPWCLLLILSMWLPVDSQCCIWICVHSSDLQSPHVAQVNTYTVRQWTTLSLLLVDRGGQPVAQSPFIVPFSLSCCNPLDIALLLLHHIGVVSIDLVQAGPRMSIWLEVRLTQNRTGRWKSSFWPSQC